MTVEAGISGPELNKALSAYGLTLRHYPQSWEFSTVGGWVATRAGGHYATQLTHIDNLVHSLRAMTARGELKTFGVPASGAGPSALALWLGSEGALGVIVDVTLRVQRRAICHKRATVQFPNMEMGTMAVKALVQGALPIQPQTCRLLDAHEAQLTQLSSEPKATLLLGYEGTHVDDGPFLEALLDRALKICFEYKPCRVQTLKDSAEASPNPNRNPNPNSQSDGAESERAAWRDVFLSAPYVRDELVRRGWLIETFETCCTWTMFKALDKALRVTVAETLKAYPNESSFGVITCRFTHVYSDGPAPYYTVIAPCARGSQVRVWQRVKAAVLEVLLKYSATVTHHHAVGRDHRAAFVKEQPTLFIETLGVIKKQLDPSLALNPGALIPSARL